jgi:hypothetical protein
MNIKVAVRGVMLDAPPKDPPFIETRVKAKHPREDSSFVQGMIWGCVLSLLMWTILTLMALRFWL